ncbi:acyl-CoA dehydrogenase family protein [Streptosporangium sp. NPDC051022]|uniref:acyl-CoA dehydrogenase family protein n=1 Tax=Streptosporangium sp. NPDC051022 TaxID=3155752 RepID=UPI0034406CD4
MSADRAALVAQAAELGPVFAERAVRYDREASFPHENFEDLRRIGFLGLCVPAEYGGLGASFADYVRVSEEIGRHCGATALTFNMHTATTLWTGEVADLLELSPEHRETHGKRRAALYRGMVEEGRIHSQPFSEGLNPGATAGVATRAVPVDGGYRVTGRKIFASLSGAADFYNITCQVEGEDFIRLLGVPADAEGVEIVGSWDPLGMRGTVSRTLIFKDAFVPADNEWLPPGAYDQAAGRFPFLFMSLAPSYLGLTGGVVDFTRRYLRGEVPGAPSGTRRDLPQKQFGWAQMQLMHERSRALLYHAADTMSLDPSEEQLVTAWTATLTAMETAPEVAALAIRVCGGQSMLKHLPLERMYRDARLGSTMLPWSAEVCLDRLGTARLY